MDEKTVAAPPPEPPKEKRKRGRPKIKDEVTPLLNFPGSTKEEKLLELWELWQGCMRCPLGALRQGPRCTEIVFGYGNPNADVVIVGEAPGEEEDKTKTPFIGAAGQTLNQLLASVSDEKEIQDLVDWYARANRTKDNFEKFHDGVGHWRMSEFFITNAIACRPPDNRAPTNLEIKACWERLWNIIYIVDPLLIIACGNSALAAVTRKQTVQITKSRGQIFDVEYDGKLRKVTYPIMPVLHPSFLNRVADWKLKDGYYAKTLDDLRKAMNILDFLRHQHYGTPIPKR